jgi:membrane protease YdiL (CAAX protease family)
VSKNKLPEPVEALTLVLLTYTGLILFSITLIVMITGTDDLQNQDSALSLIFMIGKLLFFGIPVYYSIKKQYDLKKLFKIKPISKEVVFLSITIGLSLIAITDEIQRVVDLIVPMPDAMKEILESPKDMQGMEWFLLFFASVFIVPLTDEGLFRGFLQGSLEGKGDPVRAVVLTSVSWTMAHFSPYLAIPIFVLGVFIGYLAWKTESVLPSIIIQAMFGLIFMILLDPSVEESFNSWYLMGEHVSPVVLVAAVGGLFYALKAIDSVE